jgi:pimeloyl-ACP methyl ester carboxylesterase
MARPLTPDEMYPAGIAGISSRFVSLSTDVRIRIVESGPSNGEPVLLIHGWGASLYMYRHALAMLPLHGFRAIAVDLRGYGLSDRPTTRGAYSLTAYIADLDALFDTLGVRRAAVIAQSMGGGLALRYAQRRPGRLTKLVLVNPTNLVRIAWVFLMRVMPPLIMRALGRRAIPRWLVRFILERIAYGDPARVSDRDVDEYWAPTQIAGYVHAIRAAISEFNWSPLTPAEARELAVPSLVILGTQDRLVTNARPAAERLHDARVLSVVGGHCVHEEHPEAVYDIVTEFLKSGSIK